METSGEEVFRRLNKHPGQCLGWVWMTQEKGSRKDGADGEFLTG